MNITMFGAGLIGKTIAKDLAQEADLTVTVIDLNAQALDRLAAEAPIQGICADIRQPGVIGNLVATADLVLCAVPGFMGFATLQPIIEAGKHVVDISFFPEDAFQLDALAKAKGVTAVVDCGVAPGLSNILAGYVETKLDHIERFVCYVGGLPQVRQWPYEYKAVFSPVDVLEEYTRPARFVEYGQEVVRPALSDVELLDFPGVGTLEAFNTDGLRSLQQTLNAPFMKEKTLRYPGHVNLMRVFRESGFLGTEAVNVGDTRVRPIDLTAKLLFDQWRLQAGEEDLTVMQVIVEGQQGDARLRYTYDLLDHFDRATQTSSMARTTGYTATLVARLLLRGEFTQTGICPPEFVGRTPGCYASLLAGYTQRQIQIRETVSRL